MKMFIEVSTKVLPLVRWEVPVLMSRQYLLMLKPDVLNDEREDLIGK